MSHPDDPEIPSAPPPNLGQPDALPNPDVAPPAAADIPEQSAAVPVPPYPPSQLFPPGVAMPPPSQPMPPGYPYAQPYHPPSQPLPPGYPFSQPYPPGYPPSQPMWPGYAIDPATGQMVPAPGQVAIATGPAPTEARPHPLTHPLPWWDLLAGTLAGLAIVSAVAATGTDWAQAGVNAGLVAGGIGVAVALFTGLRVALGLLNARNTTRVRQIVALSILTGLLFVSVGLGFALQNPLHRIQAAVLENGKQWDQAIKEYQLAGEAAPNSATLAQVNNEWGEQLTTQKQYDPAIARFEKVLSDFKGIASAVARAQRGEVKAYLGWGQQSLDQGKYADATFRLDILMGLPFCDAACKGQATPIDAQAYLKLGKQQISAMQCAAAATTYTNLAQRFPSTAEGQEAAKDLQAPQAVIGDFKFPGTLKPEISLTFALISTQTPATTLDQVKLAILNSPYTSQVGSTGAYNVPNVPLDDYVAALIQMTSGKLTQIYILGDTSSGTAQVLIITVAPLCPTLVTVTAATLATAPLLPTMAYLLPAQPGQVSWLGAFREARWQKAYSLAGRWLM